MSERWFAHTYLPRALSYDQLRDSSAPSVSPAVTSISSTESPVAVEKSMGAENRNVTGAIGLHPSKSAVQASA